MIHSYTITERKKGLTPSAFIRFNTETIETWGRFIALFKATVNQSALKQAHTKTRYPSKNTVGYNIITHSHKRSSNGLLIII